MTRPIRLSAVTTAFAGSSTKRSCTSRQSCAKRSRSASGSGLYVELCTLLLPANQLGLGGAPVVVRLHRPVVLIAEARAQRRGPAPHGRHCDQPDDDQGRDENKDPHQSCHRISPRDPFCSLYPFAGDQTVTSATPPTRSRVDRR